MIVWNCGRHQASIYKTFKIWNSERLAVFLRYQWCNLMSSILSPFDLIWYYHFIGFAQLLTRFAQNHIFPHIIQKVKIYYFHKILKCFEGFEKFSASTNFFSFRSSRGEKYRHIWIWLLCWHHLHDTYQVGHVLMIFNIQAF